MLSHIAQLRNIQPIPGGSITLGLAGSRFEFIANGRITSLHTVESYARDTGISQGFAHAIFHGGIQGLPEVAATVF